jgi:hypothetical protein
MRSILLLLLLSSAAFAQNSGAVSPVVPNAPAPPPVAPTATEPPTRNLWTCTLPGGSYQVLVSAILSVSQHEYIVDGAARVTEVNIDTAGQFAVRFYYIEPAATAGPGGIGAATIGKVQGILSDAADRSGTDAWKKVVKSYPATTHARTIEYRVSSKDSLTQIFTSAANSQATGRPGQVNVAN